MELQKISFWISMFCLFLSFVYDAGFLIPAFGWFAFVIIIQIEEDRRAECFGALGKMFKHNFEEMGEHLKNGDDEAFKAAQKRGKELTSSVKNLFQHL